MTRWDAPRMIVRRAKNRKAPGLVLVSIHVRADFSVRGGSSRGDMNPSRTLGGVTRYRWFESGSLQRRVSLTREPAFRRARRASRRGRIRSAAAAARRLRQK
jgi:hypothetical protein